MPYEAFSQGASWGIAFLIGGEAVSTFVAKACSSPQTTELNADKRADTLIKWVNVGMVEAAIMVSAAAYFDKKHRVPIIAGAVAEAIITYGEYFHARAAGVAAIANGAPTTEDW
jgi:uncharacterized membrane protein